MIKTCPHCQKSFQGHANKIYCGIVCRWVVNKRRWRHRHPEKAREQSLRNGRRYFLNNPGKNKEKCKRWREANKDKHAEINRKWKENNPEKVKARRQRRSRVKTEEGVVEWMELQVNPKTSQVCFYCGEDCKGSFHWDHFIPVNLGGPNAPWNLHISCPGCNLRKGAKRPESRFCEELFI